MIRPFSRTWRGLIDDLRTVIARGWVWATGALGLRGKAPTLPSNDVLSLQEEGPALLNAGALSSQNKAVAPFNADDTELCADADRGQMKLTFANQHQADREFVFVLPREEKLVSLENKLMSVGIACDTFHPRNMPYMCSFFDEYDENTPLCEVRGLTHGATIITNVYLGGPRNYKWEPFVQSVAPELSSVEVGLWPKVTLGFRPVGRKKINLQRLVELTRSQACLYGNAWHRYEPAVKHCFWLNTHGLPKSRLMVLKLRASLVDCIATREDGSVDLQPMLVAIDKVRYRSDNIPNFYYGGDLRSWQRYTNAFPLPCAMHVTETDANQKETETRNSVEVVLRRKLQPGTWYAIVLLHTTHHYSDYIYEDLVLPFKTTENEAEDEKCCVCLEREVSVLFWPCRHRCCCDECAERLPTMRCPLCRETILPGDCLELSASIAVR